MSAFRDKSQGFEFILPTGKVMCNDKRKVIQDRRREEVERAAYSFFDAIELGERDFEELLSMLIEDLKEIKDK